MSASSESSCSESSSQDNTSSRSASLSSPTPSDLTFTESSLDIDEFLGPPPQEPSVIRTYKIVGDNIDKNIQPRDMIYEHQTRLLHYFHSYAVRGRINSDMDDSEDIDPPSAASIELKAILPSAADKVAVLYNFSILIARILKKYMPFFQEIGDGLERHIQHEYSHEMSLKSEIVS